MDTAVELDFADGRYRFWLALPHIIELERKTGNKSVFAIYDQLGAGLGLEGDSAVYLGGGAAMITDIRETIRLGLIGGNNAVVDGQQVEVGPIRARELVDLYTFPNRPIIEGAHIAWSILHAAITGIDLKKKRDQESAESLSPSEKVS